MNRLALAEQLFAGRGAELANEWRMRRFKYTWLRTISGTYVDFWQVTENALHFAAKKVKIKVSHRQISQLMGLYTN